MKNRVYPNFFVEQGSGVLVVELPGLKAPVETDSPTQILNDDRFVGADSSVIDRVYPRVYTFFRKGGLKVRFVPASDTPVPAAPDPYEVAVKGLDARLDITCVADLLKLRQVHLPLASRGIENLAFDFFKNNPGRVLRFVPPGGARQPHALVIEVEGLPKQYDFANFAELRRNGNKRFDPSAWTHAPKLREVERAFALAYRHDGPICLVPKPKPPADKVAKADAILSQMPTTNAGLLTEEIGKRFAREVERAEAAGQINQELARKVAQVGETLITETVGRFSDMAKAFKPVKVEPPQPKAFVPWTEAQMREQILVMLELEVARQGNELKASRKFKTAAHTEKCEHDFSNWRRLLAYAKEKLK